MAANYVTAYLRVVLLENTIIFACVGLILVLILSVCMPCASVIWDLCAGSSTRGENGASDVPIISQIFLIIGKKCSGDMDFQVLIFTGSRYGVTSELSDLVSICNNWSLQS
ncbi:hypothetical protein QL285_097440 [Trifolium repens]|nr:hypothetical protein QL285_097440 [Trifolium repens]